MNFIFYPERTFHQLWPQIHKMTILNSQYRSSSSLVSRCPWKITFIIALSLFISPAKSQDGLICISNRQDFFVDSAGGIRMKKEVENLTNILNIWFSWVVFYERPPFLPPFHFTRNIAWIEDQQQKNHTNFSSAFMNIVFPPKGGFPILWIIHTGFSFSQFFRGGNFQRSRYRQIEQNYSWNFLLPQQKCAPGISLRTFREKAQDMEI